MRIIYFLVIAFTVSQVYSKDLDFNYFTITVEDNWPVKDELSEKHIQIFDSSDNSTNTLKLRYVYTSRDINIEELKSQNKSLKIKQLGDFLGASASTKISIDDGSHHKSWILYHKNVLLLVTYSSEKGISGLESQAVQAVLSSLRWKSAETIAAH